MNKKASVVGVILLFFLFMNISFSSAVCTSTDTPRINPVNYFELGEEEVFVYDFNLTNMDEQEVSYTFALFDRKLTGISISSDGVLRFEPSSDDAGLSKIAVVAVKESCADTLIVTFKIFAKPKIDFFEPRNSSVQINQTQSVYFRARATDEDDEALFYEWFLDSELINESINKTSYTFKPGYELSGIHNISVRVTDSHNLSDIRTWYVQVSKVNRAPVLLFPVPNYLIFQNTASGAYYLNDYFYDPDGGTLTFSYRQVNPAFEVKEVTYANVSVNIDKTGFVTYDPGLNTRGYAYFVFTAYDLMNKSVESNIVKVDVVSSDKFNTLKNVSKTDFCGDYVCSAVEDCSTCPFDCGPCKDEEMGCMPDWSCSEWGPCMPGGFMIRNCTDISNCGDNRSKPDDIIMCEYTATCDDGLKNGIEEGVDCGDPCDPCPTCNDSIQNQGEEDVDCGGPCPEICPGCTDGVQNQDESDVDCGGVCSRCAGNQSCLKNMDCESLRCEYLVCTFPSCEDDIGNQGEEGIDCGGPCAKRCGTCSDGIQNGGELGIDCGGLCKPCPTCDDAIKNGDERLADCGGECRKCNFGDYLQAYYAGFIILFIILGIIPILLISYFFYLLTRPEKARGLYEHNSSFAFIVGANKFFRKIRKKSPVISEEVAKNFINELNEMSKSPTINDKELFERILRIYAALLGLPEEYDNNIFNMKLRASKIPLFMKILFMGFYKKAEILVMATFVPQEVKLDMILEMKFLLSELVKG